MAYPDVSVIVPIYNAEPWLRECLDSVLAQRGVALEIICVNDGSTDNSQLIVDEYCAADSRVISIAQPNGGLSAARNTGLRHATGRYICFLDQDDYWIGNQLRFLLADADRLRLDILF
ncbi:MAG: glycosyltransferase, partial [Promicromonosporaceae bacterium]|nr:glycosyltransferase [Promicromonosporaceae bacterium]